MAVASTLTTSCAGLVDPDEPAERLRQLSLAGLRLAVASGLEANDDRVSAVESLSSVDRKLERRHGVVHGRRPLAAHLPLFTFRLAVGHRLAVLLEQLSERDGRLRTWRDVVDARRRRCRGGRMDWCGVRCGVLCRRSDAARGWRAPCCREPRQRTALPPAASRRCRTWLPPSGGRKKEEGKRRSAVPSSIPISWRSSRSSRCRRWR